MSKKPVGNDGTTRLTMSEDGSANIEFIADDIGITKDEIERTIVGRFVAAMGKATGQALSWKQNEENDLDFTLIAPGGEIDLELTELVIIGQKGPPFASGNKIRTMGEIAESLVARIRDKDAHYQRSATPKHLLVYATHYPFSPPDAAIKIAQHTLRHTPPSVLENVFFLDQPPMGAEIRCLFPVPDNILQGFDVEAWRDRQFIQFDPAKATLVEDKPD